MAEMRYFKKLAPGTAVPIPNRPSILFATLDHVVGWCGTNDAVIQAAFEEHMRNDRCGITEVQAAEFVSQYLEKKRAGIISSPLSREEFSAGRTLSKLVNQSRDLASASAAVAVGVAKPAPPVQAATVADPAKAPVPALVNPVLTPPTVKRKAVRKVIQPT